MKKTIGIVFVMILSISLMTACTGAENKQTIESTVPTSQTVTMNIEDTLPAGSTPTETTLQDPEENQNADYYSVCTNYSKSEVEQFAKEVRDFILAEDWESLSEYVVYPITMAGITYNDSAAFLTAPFGTQLDEASIESIHNIDILRLLCYYEENQTVKVLLCRRFYF